MTEVINIENKLSEFSEHWVPKVIGELNGQYVKVAKFQGEYVWHFHENEDELFWVIKGQMDLHVRDAEGNETVQSLSPGEFYIVPRGVEHKPVAADEVHCVLFEPASTRNTGNVTNERTIEPEKLESI